MKIKMACIIFHICYQNPFRQSCLKISSIYFNHYHHITHKRHLEFLSHHAVNFHKYVWRGKKNCRVERRPATALLTVSKIDLECERIGRMVITNKFNIFGCCFRFSLVSNVFLHGKSISFGIIWRARTQQIEKWKTNFCIDSFSRQNKS